jgi:2-(1,2-epoxy-1,2-dihydrophenyl)acetyl-CoA isomerase
MYQYILFEKSDRVATITLNRPEVYHALNPVMIHEITQAIVEAENDETVRVIVMTGKGEKAFSSGADLKGTFDSGKSVSQILEKYYDPMIQAIRNVPKPVICRMNGLAVGAGCSLALACDVVVASEEAYLSLLFVQIGLMPDAGSTFFLPRLVGQRTAFELASTGRKVYGPEAARIGLINKSVLSTELDAEIGQMVSYYQSAPTLAIGSMKRVLNQSFHLNLEEMQDLERQNQEKLFQTKDSREGISSFLRKEKPDFQGK